jgi:hypothetical protein
MTRLRSMNLVVKIRLVEDLHDRLVRRFSILRQKDNGPVLMGPRTFVAVFTRAQARGKGNKAGPLKYNQSVARSPV